MQNGHGKYLWRYRQLNFGVYTKFSAIKYSQNNPSGNF